MLAHAPGTLPGVLGVDAAAIARWVAESDSASDPCPDSPLRLGAQGAARSVTTRQEGAPFARLAGLVPPVGIVMSKQPAEGRLDAWKRTFALE